MNKIPNFFVVGAPKCGTTSLYYYFSQHPEIYLSSIKEPVYFAKDIVDWKERCKFSNTYFDPESYFKQNNLYFVHIAYLKKLEHYLELFRNVKDEKAIGDMAVLNLFSKVAAKEIYNFNQQAKIIIILRNPVDRAFSHFSANLRDGKIMNKDFLKSVLLDFKKEDFECKYNFIEIGFYYEQVKRYIDIFPKKNIKILLYEDYKKDIQKLCYNLFDFLGVSYDVDIDFRIKKNESIIPKYPKINNIIKKIRRKFKRVAPREVSPFFKRIYNLLIMEKEKPLLSSKAKEYLLSFFKEDILKTQDLIGRDLSQWLKIE